MQRKEPTSCLIDALCYKVGWIGLLEFFLIRKRIVPLCIWHRATIEPYVNDVFFSLKNTTILYQGDSIDIWLM